MGLEAYLFYVEFKEPVSEQEIISLFENSGMEHLTSKYSKRTPDNYGSFYFERRTAQGLTEAHCLLAPSDNTIKEFSLRFSVLSPSTVIDQTFGIMKKINALQPIAVMDSEISNHVYRKLRKDKKVDDCFNGIEGTDEEAKIEKMSFIPIDAEIFIQNPLGIMKREIVINNHKGKIIESGSATINFIKKKGLFNRFVGWVKKEL